MNRNLSMYGHFSDIAPRYKQIRTTDKEVIMFIAETMKDLPELKAADIGCGDGRYDLLLFQHLKNLHLTCIDINDSMLEKVSDYLSGHGITNFKTVKADAAGEMPLENNSMDCILTFNAVHHFNFDKFIKNSGRALKTSGRIFVYTRLRSQNSRNIWGQHFPLFSEKETRLYELDEIEKRIQSADSLMLETIKIFRYKRLVTLKQLAEKVKARHYSTFCLYEEDELNKALKEFQKNIRRHFHDTNKIDWFDENVLLLLKPK